MPKARKILKRAKAVQAIRDVTNTMEMVATARFKKAHDRVVANKPFVKRLAETVGDIVRRGGGELSHPLLRPPPPDLKQMVMFVITANRGLCGAYNSSVLRAAMERLRQLEADGNTVHLHVVGKRGISAMKFRGLKLERTYTEFDYNPSYEAVRKVADEVIAAYSARQVSGLDVAYMQFISSGRQQATVAQLLPLGLEPREPQVSTSKTMFELLPSANEIMRTLLPLAVRMRLYQAFLDGSVSEQVMRIAAMRAATENADEMIHTLKVRYNRQRQAQITTELSEIMGGRGAVEE